MGVLSIPRTPELTIGIVIHDAISAEQARVAMDSIYAACVGIRYELILVDNASGHGRKSLCHFSGIRLIENTANRGFGAAHNQAMQASRGRHYLALNPDVVLQPGCLTVLLAFLRSHHEARILGCKLLNDDGSTQPSCRRFPTIGDALARHLPFLGNRACYEMRDYDHKAAREVDWVNGAFMLMREPYFFDERFFLYFEDVDLCRRIGGVYYVPQAVAVHRGRYASRSSLKWKLIHAYSMLRYFLRHHSAPRAG